MTMVIGQEPLRDENCLVVWRNRFGRLAYGSYHSFLNGRSSAASSAADVDWDTTIDTAVSLAERNGIPLVYVVRP